MHPAKFFAPASDLAANDRNGNRSGDHLLGTASSNPELTKYLAGSPRYGRLLSDRFSAQISPQKPWISFHCEPSRAQ